MRTCLAIACVLFFSTYSYGQIIPVEKFNPFRKKPHLKEFDDLVDRLRKAGGEVVHLDKRDVIRLPVPGQAKASSTSTPDVIFYLHYINNDYSFPLIAGDIGSSADDLSIYFVVDEKDQKISLSKNISGLKIRDESRIRVRIYKEAKFGGTPRVVNESVKLLRFGDDDWNDKIVSFKIEKK